MTFSLQSVETPCCFCVHCRYYSRNAKGNLKNVPYVDNSCKWAGGGLLSTVGDLLHFGNAMLYSYQWQSELVSHVSILNAVYCDMFLSLGVSTALTGA